MNFLKNIFKITWANLKCEYYLFTEGMWRGECKLTKTSNDEMLIAAVTGSILRNTVEIKKIFLHIKGNDTV